LIRDYTSVSVICSCVSFYPSL